MGGSRLPWPLYYRPARGKPEGVHRGPRRNGTTTCRSCSRHPGRSSVRWMTPARVLGDRERRVGVARLGGDGVGVARRRGDADGPVGGRARRRRAGGPCVPSSSAGVALCVVLRGRLAGLDMRDEVARVALGVGVLAPSPAGGGRSAARSPRGSPTIRQTTRTSTSVKPLGAAVGMWIAAGSRFAPGRATVPAIGSGRATQGPPATHHSASIALGYQTPPALQPPSFGGRAGARDRRAAVLSRVIVNVWLAVLRVRGHVVAVGAASRTWT